MPIYGISDFKRLPRLGKIKLGKKQKTQKGSEYPIQTKYFVCPEEIQKIYGQEPTALDIMFPLNDVEVVFPQYFKQYGKTGLKCKGDGKTALAMVGGVLKERTCTPGSSECAGCKPIGVLNILLPKVPGFGVWQIWTSSWNSIVNLNSSIDMIKAMTGGKIAFIPLKLKLQEHNATVMKDDGSQFQKVVYVMTLNVDATMGEFYERYSLEANHRKSLESPEYKALSEANDALSKITKHKNAADDFILNQEADELDDLDEWEIDNAVNSNKHEQAIQCSDCGKLISVAEKEYSEKYFGKILCIDCQKKAKKG